MMVVDVDEEEEVCHMDRRDAHARRDGGGNRVSRCGEARGGGCGVS